MKRVVISGRVHVTTHEGGSIQSDRQGSGRADAYFVGRFGRELRAGLRACPCRCDRIHSLTLHEYGSRHRACHATYPAAQDKHGTVNPMQQIWRFGRGNAASLASLATMSAARTTHIPLESMSPLDARYRDFETPGRTSSFYFTPFLPSDTSLYSVCAGYFIFYFNFKNQPSTSSRWFYSKRCT